MISQDNSKTVMVPSWNEEATRRKSVRNLSQGEFFFSEYGSKVITEQESRRTSTYLVHLS